jgi:hypothetical protein
MEVSDIPVLDRAEDANCARARRPKGSVVPAGIF